MLPRIVGAGLAAYLLGSIPPGIFWAWLFRHIDVRLHGSGRTGGTNVWRTAGFGAAVLTALTDALKGAAAIWVAGVMGVPVWGVALAGALAIVGHNYSIFLGFHGGAGTATSIGVAAALWTMSLAILPATLVVVGLLVGHASVASITVALALPVIFFLRGSVPEAVGFGLPTMALTLWALRPNIERLRRRAERFLPVFKNKPPLIHLSDHPADRRNRAKVAAS
ncbi:MAG: glycerol-3-phosphate acyltransferase [Anaerolineae bacterium]|nr:glycerol-3-phosphate acyltransferase [Anaerolineae bacterium]